MTAIVGAFLLTAGFVADATGGHLTAGAATRAFETVSIDSRRIETGALFIALRGERFDGHDFVAQAVAAGAAGVLVETPQPAAGDVVMIVVPDTLAALQVLGRDVRRRSGARVVAITGSAGKTTTKELTADLLAIRYRVFRNEGNLNNHIGLPLSLLALRHGPEVAVVELGMNHAGEVRTLVGLAEPDIRVWTNVGDAHLGFFGSREAIASAKAEILELARPGDAVVANADDALVVRHVRTWTGRCVWFGESPMAGVRADDVTDHGLEGTEAVVHTGRGALRVRLPLPGRGQLHNALAAVAVALELEVPPASIPDRLAAAKPFGRRGTLVTLPNGVRLVDDSYNASPAAVRMMLAAMAVTPTDGRRVAVLGEMLELGDDADRLHREVGEAVVRAGVTELVVVGGRAADGLAEGAISAGLAAGHIHRFDESGVAAERTAALVRRGDLVLVKGSRGIRTDLVADRLREVA